LSVDHAVKRARFPSFRTLETVEPLAAAPTPAEDAARAREAGFREGVTRGRAEGRAAALAEWAPRLAALAATLEQATSAAAAERARLAAELAETVPALAVGLARKVIERELTRGEDGVLAAIDPILRRLAHGGATAVRVAPDVAQALDAWRSQAGSASLSVTIHADATLAPGDWIIETDGGLLDGRLATQLDEAARILTEVDA